MLSEALTKKMFNYKKLEIDYSSTDTYCNIYRANVTILDTSDQIIGLWEGEWCVGKKRAARRACHVAYEFLDKTNWALVTQLTTDNRTKEELSGKVKTNYL